MSTISHIRNELVCIDTISFTLHPIIQKEDISLKKRPSDAIFEIYTNVGSIHFEFSWKK